MCGRHGGEFLSLTTERIALSLALPSPTHDDPLWISSRKLPDVAWWYGDEVILQIEVVSSYNTEKTVNKLCLGLVDQLRSWKNRLSSVSSIAGFVFPISNDNKSHKECGQCVRKVELCWNDEDFEYRATVIPLNAEEVWDTLSLVKAQQRCLLESLQSNNNNHFTLPLSDQYIKANFTHSAEQVKSGESVVVLNDMHAYKCPLGLRANRRLQQLLGLQPSFGSSYTAGAFPQRNTGHFFEFNK